MRSQTGYKPKVRETNARRLASKTTVDLQPPPITESRERLLAAASHFFLSGSYHGVGIAEICAAASVQKGTFYHFFPSKTDLLLAVIERRVLEIEDTVTKIASGKVPAARKIVQLFAASQQTAGDTLKDTPRDCLPPGYFLGNIVLELASSNPPVQAAAKNAFNRWIKSIAVIVAQLIAEEKLSALDPEDAAEAVLALVQGGAVMASAYNEPRKMRAYGNIALTLLRASATPA
jgi:TetR/AcrR family transcriptional regulator, transcriptional repressor for nem operon